MSEIYEAFKEPACGPEQGCVLCPPSPVLLADLRTDGEHPRRRREADSALAGMSGNPVHYRALDLGRYGNTDGSCERQCAMGLSI
jgi:hypothetical protein